MKISFNCVLGYSRSGKDHYAKAVYPFAYVFKYADAVKDTLRKLGVGEHRIEGEQREEKIGNTPFSCLDLMQGTFLLVNAKPKLKQECMDYVNKKLLEAVEEAEEEAYFPVVFTDIRNTEEVLNLVYLANSLEAQGHTVEFYLDEEFQPRDVEPGFADAGIDASISFIRSLIKIQNVIEETA